MPQRTPKVAIIGRINTGKSTLFNRLSESRQAITSDVEGTTRDLNMAQISWAGYEFKLIDSGGVDIREIKASIKGLEQKIKPSVGSIEAQVMRQTQKAIATADVIIFLVDGKAGVTASDRELAKVLHRTKKRVVVACNKIDSPKHQAKVGEFYKLGFKEVLAVSAANGSGTGDLLDALIVHFKKLAFRPKKPVADTKKIFVTIIGKPNVGKSSLLNALAGDDRAIVSPIPQTTREPQDITIQFEGYDITIVDTAGIKRRAQVDPGINTIATAKSLDAIKQSDIVLFMLDAQEPITSQDARLANIVNEALAGAIIIVNKWDLIEKNQNSNAYYQNLITRQLPPLKWAPYIFISAKNGQNIQKLLALIVELSQRRHLSVTQEELDEFTRQLIQHKRPYGGTEMERPRIRGIEQRQTDPPEFIVHLGRNQTLAQSYVRYIENSFRKKYFLEGVNIKVTIDSPRKNV